jgi:hypothetical protein
MRSAFAWLRDDMLRNLDIGNVGPGRLFANAHVQNMAIRATLASLWVCSIILTSWTTLPADGLRSRK